MRKLAGLRQSTLVDAAITPVMRIAFRVMHLSPRLQLVALRILSPSTAPVVAPVLLGIPPQNAATLTPAEARERYGVLRPTEEYARFREHIARRLAAKATAGGADEMTLRERAFGESEAILGPVG
jgi:hypothetical protein